MARPGPSPRPPPAWLAALPNLLTVARLALAAALPFASRTAWLPIVVAAGLSDFLDGFLARRLHAMTPLGAWLDGVADKVFVLVALLVLAGAGDVALWQVPLALARDLVVAGVLLAVTIHREWSALREVAPRLAGKLTTGVVFAWFVTVLVGAPALLREVAFVLAAGTSVVAAADYLGQAVRAARTRRQKSIRTMPQTPPRRSR